MLARADGSASPPQGSAPRALVEIVGVAPGAIGLEADALLGFLRFGWQGNGELVLARVDGLLDRGCPKLLAVEIDVAPRDGVDPQLSLAFGFFFLLFSLFVAHLEGIGARLKLKSSERIAVILLAVFRVNLELNGFRRVQIGDRERRAPLCSRR